ncbi:hypothetical protein E8E13_004270 [Curvularia kusanoi]|uniref:DUF6536 domain-containing protein n=1 Tax=Curvularia kusanoi TaxID=90978 RepID=A0A9P4WEK6_CURKU|nr:hypothetical protein E8E13_004270 [Curvularia kusanoi]
MRLPQRFQIFQRVPCEEDQNILLPTYPTQTRIGREDDQEPQFGGVYEAMQANTEYAGGEHGSRQYTVTHRKTLVERLENFEERRFGSRVISFVYGNFVAGWRAGLHRAFIFSLAALLVNASIFLWLYLEFDHPGGTGTIKVSNCGDIGKIETGVKVGLNVISTLILGASTYAMQGTTSPTREEVDLAHKKGKWLEIGTQSWRNLGYVSRRHATLWGVLALTSLPLHLIFNAVFFHTTEIYQYAVAVVSSDFLDNTAFQITPENSSPALRFPDEQLRWDSTTDPCKTPDCNWDVKNDTLITQFLNDVRIPSKRIDKSTGVIVDSTRDKEVSVYERLTNGDCLSSFAKGFIQSYSDVLVVSKNVQSESPILWTRYPQLTVTKDKKQSHKDPFHWVCHDRLQTENSKDHDRCSRTFALKEVQPKNWTTSDWTVYGHPVDYCYARIAPEMCHLQYNASIMLAVVLFSLVKVLAIAVLVFTHPGGEFLRTLGDAVSSYLKKSDPVTKDMCLVSSAQIRKFGLPTESVTLTVTKSRRRWLVGAKVEETVMLPYAPQVFISTRPRWWTSANTAEFFSTVGISGAYVIILSCTLYWAIDETNGNAFDSGLGGGANIQSLASLRRDDPRASVIVSTILTANIPQLGFSLLYVFYTNIWSKLLIAQEFDRLTTTKKGLRVT